MSDRHDSQSIAVIIPAINESCCIERAIRSAIQGGAHETIVVDGGSSDDTIARAQACGATVLATKPGRGHQLNYGADCSTADLLLFLHADNALPLDFAWQIAQSRRRPGVRAGVFFQKIDFRHPLIPLWSWGNACRARWWGLAYGDQGIWIERSLFQMLGRFPEVPLMEDYLFSEKLRRKNRYVVLKGPLLVSARRWQQSGLLRQTWTNWKIIADYRRGVPLDELRNRYRRHDQVGR